MAKLRDLAPRLDGSTLYFRCPACGKHDINVGVTPGAPRDRRHGMKGSPPDWDSITLTPSVGTENAKGIGKHCGWHGHVTNGEAR